VEICLRQREYAIAESSSQWTGGGGALVEKRISLTTAFYCAHGGFLIALIWALYLPNTEAMGLGMLMIITGFFYSSPPLRLCCKGLGELIVALNLVFLEGNMGYVLQGGKLYAKETIVFVPIFLIAFFRQLMMNMPDLKTDKMVGKATLAVYLGHVISARVHLFGFALVYMMMPFLCFYYPVPKMWIAFMYVLSLPWGASITYRLNMQPSHLPLLEILAKESSLHLAWTASCTTFAYMTVECLENTCDWYKGLPPLFWMTTVGTIVIFKLKI
jgi:1,4-dihydroxy-2-naphthoate octaprenyltransferase